MLDLLMKRRSIRKYKNEQIPKEIIDKILQGALTSPTSKNRRPWELVVVQDSKILHRLGETRGHASRPIANAPLAIVVIADPNSSEIWIEDTSIISAVIQLMAQSQGLGSCWIQVRGRVNENNENVEDLVKDILNIPEGYNVATMISIGYPDEEKSSHDVNNLPFDKVHYDGF